MDANIMMLGTATPGPAHDVLNLDNTG